MSVELDGNGEFLFDAVFDAAAGQADIFEECRSLVQSAVDGYPVTIFCYGQTGAGKTHTMYGTDADPGIAPRAVAELFRLCEEQAHRRECNVYASMVELYNNDLADLLLTKSAEKDPYPEGSRRRNTPTLDNFKEIQVLSAKEMSRLLWSG